MALSGPKDLKLLNMANNQLRGIYHLHWII